MNSKIYLTHLFAILFCVTGQLSGIEISTSVNPERIDLGDSFQFQIEISNGKLTETPAIPKGPYSVEGPRVGSSSSLSIMFGRRTQTAKYSYTWVITPQKGGTITIPGFTVKTDDGGTYATKAVSVHVRKPGSDPELFLEISNPGKNLYPEQEFNIILTIYAARLKGGYKNRDPFPETENKVQVWPGLTIPWLAGLKGFEKESPEKYNAFLNSLQPKSRGAGFTINGLTMNQGFLSSTKAKFPLSRKTVSRKGPDGIERDYFVYSLTKKFIAKEFGKYTFLPVIAKNYVLSQTGNQIRPKEIYTRSNSFSVRIIPPPLDNQPPFYTGAIGDFRIFTKASATKVHVGDPISFEIHITGKGAFDNIAPLKLSSQKGFEGFKVYDEPKAGDVKNLVSSEKVYIYKIRLKEGGGEQIPPVAFSFFDPEAEEYKTIHSKPITLEILKTEGLVKPSVVSNANYKTDKPEAHKLESTGRGIHADHSGMSALVQQKPFNPVNFNSMLIFLGFLPPVLFTLIAGAITWHRRANSDLKKQRTRGALSKAQTNLRKAHKALRTQDSSDFYPAAGNVLKGFITDRLGLPEHGVTQFEIESQLKDKEIASEDISSIQEIIERCDAARFSSVTADKEAMKKDYKSVSGLLAKLRKSL